MCAAPYGVEYKPTDENKGDAPVPRRARKTMIIGRVIGWFLVAAGVLLLVKDIFGWVDGGAFAPVAAGELWFALHPGSLMLAEPVVSRYIPLIGPWLWHPVIATTLTGPAFVVVMVPGLILSYAFRRRPRLRPKSVTD